MNHIHHHEPWVMASNHLAGTRLENFTFPNAPMNCSAAARNQMAGINQRNFMSQDAPANGVDNGRHANVFHGLPAHGYHHGHGQHSYWFHHGHGHCAYGFGHPHGFWRHANRGRQVDVMWNLLLFFSPCLVSPVQLPSLNSRGRDSNNWSHLLHSAIITAENFCCSTSALPSAINK
ncbi:unnamed protein product [Musa textilis]